LTDPKTQQGVFKTYKTKKAKKIKLEDIDTCLGVCFLLKNQSDLENLEEFLTKKGSKMQKLIGWLDEAPKLMRDSQVLLGDSCLNMS
jgi:hypothetical protein